MYATLQRSGGVEAVARRLSVSTPLADQLTAALLPFVLGGVRRHLAQDMDQAAAVIALEDLIEPFGGPRLAAGVLGLDPLADDAGHDLVEAVLGDTATVSAVIAHARRATGASAAHVDAALALVTMLATGYVAARIGTAEDIDEEVVAEVRRLVGGEAPRNPLDALAI